MASKRRRAHAEQSATSYTNETESVHELTFPGCMYEVHPGETVEFPEGTDIRVCDKVSGEVLIGPQPQEEEEE